MGIFDRLRAHSKRDAEPIEPEGSLRGIVISSPRPASEQRPIRTDRYAIQCPDGSTFEPTGIDASGLPTYDHLFPNGPYQFFRNPPPRPGPKDPRRPQTSKKTPITIPSPVLGIICKRGLVNKAEMAILARLNHSVYDTVIPHLYRQITIDRYSILRILYGIPLPVSGYSFDPNATFNAKGKKKQVYKEEDVVPPAVERRKRKCLEYVKEIVLDEPLLDYKTCQSLIRLRDPSYAMDASDTQPAGQFQPMREPAESSSAPSTEISTTLMPNVDTVYLTPALNHALVQWEKTSKSPHLLLDAIVALCGQKTIKPLDLSGKTKSEPTRSQDPGGSESAEKKDFVDELNETFGPKCMTWHPFQMNLKELDEWLLDRDVPVPTPR
jgi:hypothetical protein